MLESEHLSSLQDLLQLDEVAVDLAGSLQVVSNESIELADSIRVKVVTMPVVEARALPAFERSLQPQAKDVALLNKAPAVRVLGNLTMNVPTQGWRFPAPGEFVTPPVFKLTH